MSEETALPGQPANVAGDDALRRDGPQLLAQPAACDPDRLRRMVIAVHREAHFSAKHQVATDAAADVDHATPAGTRQDIDHLVQAYAAAEVTRHEAHHLLARVENVIFATQIR